MKIHSAIWLMLGLFLAIASWYLGEDFVLFFYAGLIITALGVFKAILGYVLSPKETKKEITEIKKINKIPPEHPHYTQCRHCGNVIRKIDYYCSMCGKRLR
jgi:hypothetical protein